MIGVCIKYFHENYGGMLQAYATIKLLEERGIDYELIQYKKKISFAFIVKAMPRLLNNVLLNDKYETLKKKIGFKRNPGIAVNDVIRTNVFHEFSKKHFKKLSEVYCGYDALCTGAGKYCAVLTGSDQLWSPAGLPTNFYNLQFVRDGIPKISYASSFGVNQIPWYQKKRTMAFLKRLDFISMRENRGSEIVRELTGRTVPTILDPVLMFDEEGWAKLIPVNKELEEAYIFAYFLGGNTSHRQAVSELAAKYGLKIVTLRHLDQYIEEDELFGDFAPYDVSPERFLNLLRGAEYVCTDSFHGACFSIIHHKQFAVFNRYNDKSINSKNSRIDTLCKNLGLMDRRFTDGLCELINKPIDYTAVDRNLKKLIQTADEYLKESFASIV